MSASPPTDADRALAETAMALVRDGRGMAALGWPVELRRRCAKAFEQLADDAGPRGFAGIRDAALDLHGFLSGLEDGDAPDAAQGRHLATLADALADAVVRGLPGAYRSARFIDLVCERGDFPAGMARAFGQAGYALRRFSHWAEYADAALRTPGLALLVEADQLAASCAVLESLSSQVPASGSTVIFGFGPDDRGRRLESLLHGADGHATGLDEPGLAARVLETLDAPAEEPYRVLVVDDDAQSSRYLRLVLEQGGMEVHECDDPGQVQARVADHPPDLVLMDLHMPQIDGLSLTMALRRQPELALLPILFISGEEREQVRFQAIQAGADDFLIKPVRPRVLMAEVRSRIKRARLARRQLPAGTGAASVPRRGGLLRRGDFLRQLGQVQRQPRAAWPVLLSVKVDQAEAMGKRLGQSAAYELEQAIARRFAELLEPDDAYTIWLEFGFGVLVQRESRESVSDLAARLCAQVRGRPFAVQDAAVDLTVSIGLALPPVGAASGDPDRWFAAAYAGMSIAARLGGDRHDGVLDLAHGDMPAERVLIIREFVKDAAKGEHIVYEYQPILPLRDGQAGQYALATKLRDFRAPLAGIRRDEYLAPAREAGALAMIERFSLFHAFETLREERARGRPTRIQVPLDLGSLFAAQMAWLSAELKRRQALADGLVVELDAGPLLANPGLAALVRKLKDSGVTLVLSEPSGSLSKLESLFDLPVDFLRVPHAAIEGVGAGAFTSLLAPWRARGRGVMVDQVRDLESVPRLWDLGIDFLQGDALAATSPRLDYDFH